MNYLGLNEVRKKFRDFYVEKGHYAEKSASLIPKNDKSLLIINSGMAPLKPYFAGVETPPSKRLTTCQKCIRTGDIDNVGITARHGTFFEMLGNFSFGDYFKKETLTWGWEFLTEVLGLEAEKLWATVYYDDQEAIDLWTEIGMNPEHIVPLGKKDNFWEIGLGPCGPCSEIHYDRGEKYGCGKPDCKPGCDCDRYLEIWNHVFTQFSKEEDGSYSNLAHPNIDTGMGLERIACLLQGVESMFDVDTIKHIIDGISAKANVKYEAGASKTDVSIRIVTDHLRSMVFMIADGILPSNEGRGYVLRRLIRRAARHGKLLGIEGNFLVELSNLVMEVSGEAYPEIIDKKDYIQKVIAVEEEKFAQTLGQGTQILESYMEELESSKQTVLDGQKVFKLYDTYGFPMELTEEILAEKGYKADTEGFKAYMQEQKNLARANKKDISDEAWKDNDFSLDFDKTVFKGYDCLNLEAKVMAIVQDGKLVEKASGEANVYLDQTPFYATSGGQIHDKGFMSTDTANLEILDVTKSDGYFIHRVKIDGELNINDTVKAQVSTVERFGSARNHTATHLLQKALQEVLGSHVQQAGSSVNENLLRFDFTHFEAMSELEISKIEELVNEKISEFLPVNIKEMPIDEAQKMGAMALFGEKYGKTVRVVNVGDWSIELCGGTHVGNTGEIGAFKILSESGVASGVRRIEATTGAGVFKQLKDKEEVLNSLCDILKTNEKQIQSKLSNLNDEVKSLKKELDEIKKASMGEGLDELINNAKEINGVKLITNKFEGVNINELRDLADEIKAKVSSVIVFATVNDGKVTFMTCVSDDLLDKGYHAGNMIKEIAKAAGGGGGGKANMAQAGAKDPSKIEDAFKLAESLL
ncbi:MAG: alanine--tRNA ligase [Clostridia bacterium]|nr:alanine--tRNA ligase [Clostridia bacterium]